MGVSSKAGCGSTFGFFFRVKRSVQHHGYESYADEQLDNATLRCQIEELGNAAPKEIDEGIFPESLNNPPVEDTGDMVARPEHQQDDRYKRTAEITSKIPEQGNNCQKLTDRIATHADAWTVNEELEANTPSPAPAVWEGGHHFDQANTSGALASRPSVQTHILLVEDNIINQKIVMRKLESKGYKVTSAKNGKEAVDAVENAPKLSTGDKRAFDICLMDMEMPIMDGNTATKTIRVLERQGKIERIPILGVTANVRGEQQAEM